MKSLLIFVCIVCLAGCSAVQQSETPTLIQPELLEQSPLPVINSFAYKQNMRLNIRLLINEDGHVQKARFIDGSGNAEWDSLALISITKWRFSPARLNNRPISLWVNQIALVRIEDPVYISLSAIICETYECATSVYDSLLKGHDFGELARQFSSAPSKAINGYLGRVDINCYSAAIRGEINRLKDDGFTSPLKFGDKYIILKRHALLSTI